MPRDISGNYTLPAGNPVTPGTIIDVNWANPTLSDLAAAMTDSLSRSGNGGMLAPFRFADGNMGAPGIGWSNEPTSGWYRAALQDFRYSVGNEDILKVTKTAVEVSKALTLLGTLTMAGAASLGDLTVTGNTILGDAPADTITINGASMTLGANLVTSRNMGAAPAGDVAAMSNLATYVADAGGTTVSVAVLGKNTLTGANAVASSVGNEGISAHNGTGVATNLVGTRSRVEILNTGGATNAQCFEAAAPITTGAGVISTIHGLRIRNLTSTANVQGFNGISIVDQSGVFGPGGSYSGYTCGITFGAGKWGINFGGNADNAISGRLRLGSNVVPTAMLDVTGDAKISTTLTVTGNIINAGTIALVRTPEVLGYTTGGSVTQITSKATAVTLNAVTGVITMHAANLGIDAVVTFLFNNNKIAQNDFLLIEYEVGSASAAGYAVTAHCFAAGQANVSVRNITTAALAEAILLKFAVIKSQNA